MHTISHAPVHVHSTVVTLIGHVPALIDDELARPSTLALIVMLIMIMWSLRLLRLAVQPMMQRIRATATMLGALLIITGTAAIVILALASSMSGDA